jgi:hypothetical protein
VTTALARGEGKPIVWGQPYGDSGGPLTWRPIVSSVERPMAFQFDVALTTCRNGHEQTLNLRIHAIDAQGNVSPSYVCPAGGCDFHEHIRLEGWPP